MRRIKKLNKKGLSLVELMVSFALSFVILAYLLNIVLMIKNLYLISDEKTNIMIKQATMIKKIENKLNNINIDSVNTCGNNCIRFNYDGDKSTDLIVDAPNRTIKFDNYKMKFAEGTKLGNVSVSKKEISGIDISKEENKDGIVTFKIPIGHAVLDGDYGIKFTFMYNSNFTDIPDIKPEDFFSVIVSGNVASGKATNTNVTLTATVKPNNSFDIYKYKWQKKENENWVNVSNTENNTLTVTTEVKNNYRVIVTNQDGNTATSNEYNVFIDKTAPKCNVSGGSSAWTNESRTIKASCQEQGSVQSGCATSEFSKTYNTEMDVNNAGAVDIGKGGSVKDAAGNVTNCAANQVVRIDKTAPTKPAVVLKLNSSSGSTYTSGSWTNQNVYHHFTSSDSKSGIAKFQYSHDNKTWYDVPTTWPSYSKNSTTLTYIINWGGNWNFYIRAVDNVGNASPSSSYIVRIDKTKPTCVSSGGSSTWTNGSRNLVGTCSDTGGSGCKGNVSKDINYQTNSSISPGTVYDNAGNSAVCPTQVVRIDKTKPTCVSSGGNNSWTNGSRNLTGTCSDAGGSGCKGNVTKNYSNEINTTTATPGTVYDNAGNSAACPNQTVRIDKTAPYTPTNDWNMVNNFFGYSIKSGIYGDCVGSNCGGGNYSLQLQSQGNECFTERQCNTSATSKIKTSRNCSYRKVKPCGEPWVAADAGDEGGSGVKGTYTNGLSKLCKFSWKEGVYHIVWGWEYYIVDNAGNRSASLYLWELMNDVYTTNLLNYFEVRNGTWELKPGKSCPTEHPLLP